MTRAMSVVLALAVAGASALAVSPSEWSQASEAQFAKGKTENVVLSSSGELLLGRAVDVLWSSQDAPAAVTAVALVKGTLYAAGADGAIYARRQGKFVKLASLEDQLVTCMLADGQTLYVATGGKEAAIYTLSDDGKLTRHWNSGDARYVWAMAAGEAGKLYAATGVPAQVIEIPADKAGTVKLWEAGDLAKNVLALVRDGDRLLAGTDENGLVVEIKLADRASRVLFDAQEKEISSLVLDGKGGLYAGTADVSRAASGSATLRDQATGKPATAPATAPASDGANEEAAPKNGAASAGDAKAAPSPQATSTQPTSAPAAEAVGPDSPATATPAAAPAAQGRQSAPSRPAMVRRPSPAAARGDDASAAASTLKGPGNAVYRIRADGMVELVFRQGVSVLAMARDGDGTLLVATGDQGQLLAVGPSGEPVLRLADTDAKQITALAVDDDGAIYFATANKGSLNVLRPALAEKGVYTSDVLDAEQIARWGTMSVWATTGQGAAVTVQTRSGNVEKPDDKTWSQWSEAQAATDGFMPVTSPAGRFLQYRLNFTGSAAAPAVRQVRTVYQVGNLAPSVEAILVTPMPEGDAPQFARKIQVKAADANKDKLHLAIYFRQGSGPWVKIAEKLDKPEYVWDTRTVEDGTYELKVTASDLPANAPASALEGARVSEPVTVDNTPPTISELKVEQASDGVIVVTGKVTDASRLGAIAWALNSAEDWTVVEVADGLADSNSETFRIELKDVKPGLHRLAVRAADALNNTAYRGVNVEKK